MPSKYGFTTADDERARQAAAREVTVPAWCRLNPLVVDIMNDFVRATFGRQTGAVVPRFARRDGVDYPYGWQFEVFSGALVVDIYATEPDLQLCLTVGYWGRSGTPADDQLVAVLYRASGLPTYISNARELDQVIRI